MDLPIGGSMLGANRIERSLVQRGRSLYKAVFDYGDYGDLICDLMRADDLGNLLARYGAMCSNLQAVSPRIAARSASLRLGVPRMCSTAVLVHG